MCFGIFAAFRQTLDRDRDSFLLELCSLKIEKTGVIFAKNRAHHRAIQFAEFGGRLGLVLDPFAPCLRIDLFLFPDDDLTVLNCEFAADPDLEIQKIGVDMLNFLL